jgi:hypothetical protein
VKRFWAIVAPFGLLAIPLLASAAAPNISRSYTASQQIPAGSLVSLTNAQTGAVAPASTTNSRQLLGVAVKSDDSLLAINPSSSKVQVATSGSAAVLVSTLNGSLKVGDLVAVSPLAGIGMKARAGDRVVGVAQAAFSADTTGVKQRQITDTSGHKHRVSVGFVTTNLAVGTASQQALNGLQRLAQDVTGRTVSTARVVISLVIAVTALTALITLVYAAIYGGVISVGRNPLAKFVVLRTVADAIVMAVIIAVLAAAAIYLLLR